MGLPQPQHPSIRCLCRTTYTLHCLVPHFLAYPVTVLVFYYVVAFRVFTTHLSREGLEHGIVGQLVFDSLACRRRGVDGQMPFKEPENIASPDLGASSRTPTRPAPKETTLPEKPFMPTKESGLFG